MPQKIQSVEANLFIHKRPDEIKLWTETRLTAQRRNYWPYKFSGFLLNAQYNFKKLDCVISLSYNVNVSAPIYTLSIIIT